MRVSVTLPFALALIGSVLGQKVTKASIGEQFDKISASITSFGSVLAAVKDSNGIKTSMDSSNEVLATIKKATSAVSALSGQLTLEDAAELVEPSDKLAKAAVKLVKDLEDRVTWIEHVGITELVVNQLKTELAATKEFVNVVKTKVPASLAEVADAAAKTALDAVQGGIDFFSKPSGA